MEEIYLGYKMEKHPKSPDLGAIIICTDPSRHLKDPDGYRVENIGYKGDYGVGYGYFTARGVKHGCLYRFSVEEYILKS